MKKSYFNAIKNAATFLILLLTVAASTFAQTPQYYNFNNGTSANTYPFYWTNGQRVHWLIRAGTLNQPTPCPGGMIDTIYFRMASTVTTTFTNITIKMKSLAITNLPAAWFTTELDTVYFRASGSLSSVTGGWMAIPLDHPILYDTSKGLVVDVQQCGCTVSGMNVFYSVGTPYTRNYGSPNAGCPIPYVGQDGVIQNFGVHVSPAVQWYRPELIYYRFENNPTATSVFNFGCSPVGSNPAPIIGHTLGPGGQFDSCLIGAGGSTNYINTGWATNLGNNSWTLSMWLSNLPTNNQLGGNPCYLYGDPTAGSFRAFWAGAGIGTSDTAILFRHTGSPDLRLVLPNGSTTNYVVHLVYNSTNSSLRAYRNGVFVVGTTWSSPSITGTGFRVAGYTTTYSLYNNAKMDEFRLYSRALSDTEIAATWNIELPTCPVGINPISNPVPRVYSLSQNYPNPFNPSTRISYAIPKAGIVKLVVYDILGRVVKTLVNEFKIAGNYDVDFNASNYASGVYFYTLKSGDFTDTKKMVLVK